MRRETSQTDTEYGWRAKIGLLIPANNTVIEPELWRLVPDGVSLHATRLIIEGPFAPEALDRMQRGAARGVEELTQSDVDVIVYACLSTSLAKGREWDEQLPRQLLKGPRPHLFTASATVVEAMRVLGIRRPAVISPYPRTIHPLIRPFFAAYEIEVVSGRHMEIEGYRDVARVKPREVYDYAQGADLGRADGVCVLATDLRTVDIIAPLERDLNLPVVTTNQAILWKALRAAGIADHIESLGELLRH